MEDIITYDVVDCLGDVIKTFSNYNDVMDYTGHHSGMKVYRVTKKGTKTNRVLLPRM